MTNSSKLNEQFVLRIKAHSELDKLFRVMMDTNKPMSQEELIAAGGLKRSQWLVPFICRFFDNAKAVTHKDNSVSLHYTELGVVPVPISADVLSVGVSAVDEAMTRDILWPQAPPMIDSMGDTFREPSWFSTMKIMVDLGRHIALAGPPSVGKDTAVQELAASEGKILVTVGGDAGFRRRDLVGSLQISHGRSYLEVAEYAAAVTNGWWVLLSEVNAADADALMFINTQLAPPYVINIAGKAYPVHPNFRLFVTYNPGLVGTKPLPQSFKDRFFSIQVPFFSAIQLRKVLCAHGMPEYESWADCIVKYGIAMWDAHARGQLRYQISSRRLMDAVALMMCKPDNPTYMSPKEALTMAVIASIDSQVEANVAKQILNSTCAGGE